MPTVKRTALVGYSAQQMYELVNDIDSYPRFLPWCNNITILSSTAESVTATMEISKGPVKNKFTTQNTLEVNKSIKIDLVDGPFSSLAGNWSFIQSKTAGCKIDFEISFEFSNGLLAKVLEPVFYVITDTMIDSFCDEAKARYSKK